MSNQQKNDLGQFYTNLSKTVNSATNTLKNIVSNTPKTLNSLIPLTNIKKNSASNFSLRNVAPMTNTLSTASTPTNSKTGITTGWPVLVFVLIAVISIFILLKFKTQIEVGLNNIGQKIRDFFNKPSTPLEDASNIPTPVLTPPQTPQDQQRVESSPLVQSIFDKIIPSDKKEVFNISKNEYNYYDAEPLCRALGAELATYDQVKEAWSKGADWCNYGWVKGQAAVYPTQEETWKKIQSGPDENKNSCGVPGLNGGYFDNPEMRFGVNCYGKKPPQSENDQELLMKQGKIPLSVPSLEVDRKTQEFKKNLDEVGVLPFNEGTWSQ